VRLSSSRILLSLLAHLASVGFLMFASPYLEREGLVRELTIARNTVALRLRSCQFL